jgi:predicted DNA-binding transcriptional regulator YafY
MTTKKKTKLEERHIGKSEAFYIESHYGRRTAAEFAAELGVAEAEIQRYLDDLTAMGFESTGPKERTKLEQAGFAHNEKTGVVMATQTSSMLADEAQGTGFTQQTGEKKVPPRNEHFFQRRAGKGICVIDPAKPIL